MTKLVQRLNFIISVCVLFDLGWQLKVLSIGNASETPHLWSLSWLGFLLCDKTALPKVTCGGKGFSSLQLSGHSPSLKEVKVETRDRIWSRPWRDATAGLLLIVLSVYFLVPDTQGFQFRGGSAHTELGPPTSIKKMSIAFPTGQLAEKFSQLSLPLSKWLQVLLNWHRSSQQRDCPLAVKQRNYCSLDLASSGFN